MSYKREMMIAQASFVNVLLISQIFPTHFQIKFLLFFLQRFRFHWFMFRARSQNEVNFLNENRLIYNQRRDCTEIKLRRSSFYALSMNPSCLVVQLQQSTKIFLFLMMIDWNFFSHATFPPLQATTFPK